MAVTASGIDEKVGMSEAVFGSSLNVS